MADDAISVRTVAAMPIAAVRRQITGATMAREVVKAPIWSLAEARGLESLGQLVVIYHDSPDDVRLNRPGGVAADIGVLVARPFAGDRTLQCVMTPAGRAAHMRHNGHYELLPVVHADIRAWCLDQGHVIEGTNWEHYAHWHEESEQRVTDVYYLLRS